MKTGYRFLTIIVVGLLLGAMLASTAYALPPGQDPRPPDNGGGSGSGGGSDDGNGSSQQTAESCAALSGQVLNWGVGGMGSIGVSLETGSWQVSAASNTDGNYAFGGLGVGMARLKVTLPPELGGSLTPLIQDAGVYLNCDTVTIANIALYSGDSIEPPVTLELSAPAGITPGESTVIRARIKNGLPTAITNVIFTNLMPPGLTPTKVDFASNTVYATEILDGGPDGQMVYTYFPSIAAGLDENMLITVTAAPDLLTNIQLKNSATLFYRESVAVQDSIDLRVGGAPLPAVAPATATPAATPEATATASPITETMAAETVTTATVQAQPPVTATVETEAMGDEFVPPGNMPGTGDDLTGAFVAPPGQMPTTGDDLADEFVAPPNTMPTTGDDPADEFVAPPNTMPTTGDDPADEFVAPPGLLPETGVDPALPQTLPNTGLGFLLPLLGMGFGGLAFALHQLRRRF